jgi:hypothetical protein
MECGSRRRRESRSGRSHQRKVAKRVPQRRRENEIAFFSLDFSRADSEEPRVERAWRWCSLCAFAPLRSSPLFPAPIARRRFWAPRRGSTQRRRDAENLPFLLVRTWRVAFFPVLPIRSQRLGMILERGLTLASLRPLSVFALRRSPTPFSICRARAAAPPTRSVSARSR